MICAIARGDPIITRSNNSGDFGSGKSPIIKFSLGSDSVRRSPYPTILLAVNYFLQIRAHGK